MSGYTRFSCLFWEWHRLNQLAPTTRLFWLGLYTSPPAKRGVPALWHGSVTTMAEAARLPVDEAARSLDALLDHELAEYDPRSLVLRLTELPDAGEWPSNPGILDSWFKRFRMVPDCGVRNAHVTTIRWMLERGALEASKNARGAPTQKHEQVWAETFGTVTIPPPRKRGIRRHSDNNDTSTEAQPSLFGSLPGSTYPQVEGCDTNARLRSPDPMISTSGRPWTQGPEKEKEKEREKESSSSGEASPCAAVIGGGERPRLALVPPPPSADVTELLADLVAGAGQDPRHVRLREGTEQPLRATIADLVASGATTAERRAMGAWVTSRCALGQISGDPFSKMSVWAAGPGAALTALRAVRDRVRAQAEVQDQLDAINNRTPGAV